MIDPTKTQLLRESKLAAELTDEQCAIFAESITMRYLADGEILVEEGRSDPELHIIVRGTIAVSKREHPGGEWLNLNVLTNGDLVGELAFMDGRPHYAVGEGRGRG